MERPFSQACENNKRPILEVLDRVLEDCKDVLEIGSGTGQHAAFFAKNLPHLIWQCSDQHEYIQGIKLWLKEAQLTNTPPPLTLNVSNNEWPEEKFDAIFSANTAHIMHWSDVLNMFTGVGKVLNASGHFCLYGPFNYDGEFTSESNERFEQWLKKDDPSKGIRDFEKLNELAMDSGLSLITDHEMPANNRLLLWQKSKQNI